jgi:hypothetical protein
MIVSAATGYVAGTYLSSAAISSIIGGASLMAGTGAVLSATALKGMIGAALARSALVPIATEAAGIAATTATTAATTAATATSAAATTTTVAAGGAATLMSAPVLASIAVGGVAVGLGLSMYKLMLKANAAKERGEEALFTPNEAKMIERIINLDAKHVN